MEAWRSRLRDDIKTHLEAQIKEVAQFQNIYGQERDSQKIQLWLAIANLSKGIFDLNLKSNYLERALKDISDINKSILDKINNITKIDIQKEINNTFTQISDINSRLKSITIIEKDSTSIKERIIELTEKAKHIDKIEKLSQEIDEIKKVRVGVLERVKELENKDSLLDKAFNSQMKKIEKLESIQLKSKPVKAIKKKR